MLPSVPVIVTAVALVAVTVSVDELPEVIDVGLAVMVTVAAGWFTVTVAAAEVFHRLRSRWRCKSWSRSG